MKVGDKVWIRGDWEDDASFAKGGVDCFYERVDPNSATKLLSQKQGKIIIERETSSVAYGKQCPRCHKALTIFYEYHTSDGFYGYVSKSLN